MKAIAFRPPFTQGASKMKRTRLILALSAALIGPAYTALAGEVDPAKVP